MKTAGLILAAGMSSRMGAYKPLVKIQGKEMICWSIDTMCAAGITEICVVTGYESERLRSYLARWYGAFEIQCGFPKDPLWKQKVWGKIPEGKPRILLVENPRYQNKNMLDSIKCGINGLQILQTDAFFLTLADLPGIKKETYHQLLESLCRERYKGKRIAIANICGVRRHPQLILADQMERILQYENTGEGGLRGFWKQAETEILDVQVTDPGCMLDIDTRQDLLTFEKSTF